VLPATRRPVPVFPEELARPVPDTVPDNLADYQ